MRLPPVVTLSAVLLAGACGSSAESNSPAAALAIAPPFLSPSTQSGAVPQGTKVATTKAVELRVEGVTTAAAIGGRHARLGHEFVIVETSWKNIIPLKVPYVVPMLRKQIWLFTDERFADTVDLEAQAATPGALEDGFGITTLGEVVRGKLVFEAPAGSHYRAFQFYDNDNGHALIPLGGAKPGAAPMIGLVRQNDLLQLAVSEAGFAQKIEAPAGHRAFVVSVRGVSRSPRDIVDLELDKYLFAQTDQGCVVTPASGAAGLTRPFGERASFPPTNPNEGQIAFFVPEATKYVRVLVTPGQTGAITLPTGTDFTPSWPSPQQTIQDGTTMKVHVLPTPARPPGLPAPQAGREFVVLDVVLENLKADQGIELQTTQQLRLVAPDGSFIEPSPLSSQLPCHLGETGLIPAANARRFALIYDVPAGMPRKLQYRGFEKDEVILEIKR